MVMNETTPVKLLVLSNWTKVPAGYVVQMGGPFAPLDEEGDIAYVSAPKIGFTVTPGEAVYVPPRQLSFAPGGALMVLLGDDALAGLAGEWSRTKRAEREAMARLTGAIIAASVAGRMETEIAAETGLNRGTVRKALGK